MFQLCSSQIVMVLTSLHNWIVVFDSDCREFNYQSHYYLYCCTTFFTTVKHGYSEHAYNDLPLTAK